MLSATERLVPEHSDLGRSSITVNVRPQGGTFDFEVTLKPDSTDPDKPTTEPEHTSDETPSAIE